MTASDGVPKLNITSDDEPTLKLERTLIVGLTPFGEPTAQRRPWDRLSPHIVALAEEFHARPNPEAVAAMARGMMRHVERNNAELLQWLELACTHVLVLGYTPNECVIDHRDRSALTRHVLRVRGLEVFMVQISRHFDGARVETVTTPIVIGWPAPRPER